MIQIYGRTDSSNCAKIFWLLQALGISYYAVPTGGAHGGTDAPDFRKINPNGKVPVLVEGDLKLWESHAILRYLAHRHGSCSLYPQEPAPAAEIDMWLDWIATSLNPAFGSLRRARDAEATKRALPAAAAAFGLLNDHVASRTFLVGESLSLADIGVSPHVMRWFALDHDLPTFANLKRYQGVLRRDPNYRTHVEDRVERP